MEDLVARSSAHGNALGVAHFVGREAIVLFGDVHGDSGTHHNPTTISDKSAKAKAIAFGTPDSSLSLDAITVDTWNGFEVVPEPSVTSLLMSGGILLRLRRSRRF